MSVLLAGNCNLRSLSVAHIGPHVDGRATITSPLSEKVLRSTSTTPNVSYGDIDKRTGSNASCSQAVKGRMSAASASANTGTSPGNKMVITKSDTLLKRIKRSYKFLHLNRLFSLGFMLIYMFIGALLFLWLEGASDRARKLHEYKFYINEKEMFLRRLDKIYNVKASEHRRVLLKNAIDYLHQQIGVSFSNRSDWSLTTALYYSGTVLTTIGSFFLLHDFNQIDNPKILKFTMNIKC
uniref:Potassium channel domain-containing protein n=1 Tax=Setaria digitata TaxID=48799 RepID=A0A915PM09_9BILA